MTKHCEVWENELLYRLQYPKNEDVKYANGVYDMAIDIATGIERTIGHEFDDIDSVVELIYNAIKNGEEVE